MRPGTPAARVAAARTPRERPDGLAGPAGRSFVRRVACGPSAGEQTRDQPFSGRHDSRYGAAGCSTPRGWLGGHGRRRNRSRAAWPRLGDDRQGASRVDDGEHRVAASGRVVGQHDDRSPSGGTCTAPVSTPSLASSRSTARARAGPSRRAPTRLTSPDTIHARPSAARACPPRTTSIRGPGHRPTGPVCGRRGAWSTTTGGARVGSDRQRPAGDDRRRPEPRARVLAARPQHGLDGDPAPNGQVGPQRAVGGRHLDDLTGGDRRSARGPPTWPRRSGPWPAPAGRPASPGRPRRSGLPTGG